MMIDLNADHIGFVLASYGVVAVVLTALVVTVLWRSRMLKRQLRHMNLPEPGARDKS
jgi:heme exporter protein CcmD